MEEDKKIEDNKVKEAMAILGKRRWNGVPEKKRKEHMRQLALKRHRENKLSTDTEKE